MEASIFKSLFSLRTFIATFFILFIINLLYLDIIILRDFNLQNQKEIITVSSLTPSSFVPPNQICPNSCLSQIYEATSSSKPSISTSTLTPTSIPTTSYQTPPATSFVKEFFIPFGSGSSSADDWQDVAGLKVSIDSTHYSSVKSIIFEASVNIPTGNQMAFVRLFNETDKHPVWFSDVSLEGGTAQLLISKPIVLDAGNKVYKVQMKTSLKYPAILNQARVHITTN